MHQLKIHIFKKMNISSMNSDSQFFYIFIIKEEEKQRTYNTVTTVPPA